MPEDHLVVSAPGPASCRAHPRLGHLGPPRSACCCTRASIVPPCVAAVAGEPRGLLRHGGWPASWTQPLPQAATDGASCLRQTTVQCTPAYGTLCSLHTVFAPSPRRAVLWMCCQFRFLVGPCTLNLSATVGARCSLTNWRRGHRGRTGHRRRTGHRGALKAAGEEFLTPPCSNKACIAERAFFHRCI